MTPLARLCNEPYRLFFPIGTVCAALGLAVWIAFWLRPGIGYPGPAHSVIMMHGFAFSFIIGFLLTMLPRALGVPTAAAGHLLVAVAGVIGGCVAAYIGGSTAAWIGHLLALAALLSFVVSRAGSRASPPPASFACAAAGVLAALAGSAMAVAGTLGAPSWVAAFGRALDMQAFPLLMILGIGSFLIPKLAGPHGARIAVGGVWFNAAIAALMIASYAIEHAPCSHDPVLRLRIAYALRALIFGYFLGWRILPARLHAHAPAYLKSIPIALSCMATGLALPAVWPVHTLAWLHFVYVGGVLWLTLIVATRVLVGHAPARGSPPAALIFIYSSLIAVATISRMVTGVWPGRSYNLHLAGAAMLALAGVALWSCVLIRRFWSFPEKV